MSPRVLTMEERRRLRQIVDYLKPAPTHFARLVEPTPPEEIDHVELEISELGENWAMHRGHHVEPKVVLLPATCE